MGGQPDSKPTILTALPAALFSHSKKPPSVTYFNIFAPALKNGLWPPMPV